MSQPHFVIIECGHQLTVAQSNGGCIGFMLFCNLSCLGAIICDINRIGLGSVYACRVRDALVASCATVH